MNGTPQPPEVMQVELASLIHLLGGMAPKHYAEVMNPNLAPGDDEFERDRNTAYLRVSGVLDTLRDQLWE